MYDDLRIGVIGAGNIGKSLITTILDNKLVPINNIKVCRRNLEILPKFADIMSISYSISDFQLSLWADIIFICTHPKDLWDVLNEIKKQTNDSKLIVSFAAGVEPYRIWAALGFKFKVIHVTPSPYITSGVPGGISLLIRGPEVLDEDVNIVTKILSLIGSIKEIESKMLPIHTVFSACSPAFILYILRTFLQIGVDLGLTESETRDYVKSCINFPKMISWENINDIDNSINAIKTKGGATEIGIGILSNPDNLIFRESMLRTIDKIYSFNS